MPSVVSLAVHSVNFRIYLSHDLIKPTKWVCAQRRLRSAWVAKNPSFLHADSEDSDQTGRMPRLIWVFAGCTAILLVLSCRGSIELVHSMVRNLSRNLHGDKVHRILFPAETLFLSRICQHRIIDCILFIWKGRVGFSLVKFSSLNHIKWIWLIPRDFLLLLDEKTSRRTFFVSSQWSIWFCVFAEMHWLS